MSRRINAARESASLLAQAREWAGLDEPTADESPEQWTPRLIDQAARVAASRCRWSAGAAHSASLYDDALSTVGLAVAEDPGVPFWDAVSRAVDDITDQRWAAQRDNGLNSRGEAAPRFWAYWIDSTPLGIPTRCEERMTLAAVLAALPQRHVTTLMQHAFADTTALAAEHAGVGEAAYRQRVRTARRAALTLWLDGETPRLQKSQKHSDRVCRQGHVIAGENALHYQRGGRYYVRCRACRAEQRSQKAVMA